MTLRANHSSCEMPDSMISESSEKTLQSYDVIFNKIIVLGNQEQKSDSDAGDI